MAYWFYVSHLEFEPITGRERFSIVSPKQIQELSQLEFQAVNYSSVSSYKLENVSLLLKFYHHRYVWSLPTALYPLIILITQG